MQNEAMHSKYRMYGTLVAYTIASVSSHSRPCLGLAEEHHVRKERIVERPEARVFVIATETIQKLKLFKPL